LFGELLNELGALGLEDLDVDSLLEDYDEDEAADSFNYNEIDFDELEEDGPNPALLDVEMVGKQFWESVTEFGDKAREIATEIILKYVEGNLGGDHQLPTYVSRPMRAGELVDLDIDATIEAKIQDPLTDVKPWGFERQTTRNPVLLLLDTSYSMNGMKLTIAGIVVGVLSQLLPSSDIAVLGFNKQPYFIKRFDEELSSYFMINRIMNIRPRGGTNISEALRTGSEIIFPYYPHGRMLMLSDVDPTAGKNPITEAAKVNSLDILLFPDGNAWMAEKLIFEVYHGDYYPITSYNDIPKLLKKIFSKHS